MAIVSVVGETSARGARRCSRRAIVALGDIPLRLVSQAASRRNITFVLRDADVTDAMTRLHDAFFRMIATSTKPVLRAFVASWHWMRRSTGRLRQDGTDGRRPRRRVSATRSPASSIRTLRRARTDRTSDRWRGRRRRDRLLLAGRGGEECARAGAARHQRGDRHDRLAEGRSGDSPAPWPTPDVGIVAAPNFSTGVVLFEAIVARAAALFGAAARVRGVAPRGASQHEERRAVGNGADAQARDGAGGVSRVRLTSRPRAPASFPACTRSGSTARRIRLR